MLLEKVRTPRDQDIDWGKEAETMSICCKSTLFSCALPGLVPRPFISRDFILTEIVSLIQIGIMKKVR